MLERLLAERVALRLLLGADIAAAERRDDLGTGTFWYIILMPSLDACSASGMIEASPGWPIMAMPSGLAATASRSCWTIFSDVPAGEDVVDLRAGVGRRLLGAVVDDGAEGVAFGAADEEADVDVLAPVVAQRLRVAAVATP